MKAISDKRRKRNAEAKPIRDALRKDVGHCEICGRTRGVLDVHEICRGVHRQKALDKRFALLVVCRIPCHEALGSAAEWPEARQLAMLAQSRPLEFSLASYLKLTNPNAPRRIEIAEVLAWMPHEYLTKNDIADMMQVDRRSVNNWIQEGQLPALDARTAGSSKPLYRVAWQDFLDFCQRRRVAAAAD